MTGLESILAQITGDAAREAEKLLAQGREEAAASLADAKAEAEKKAQEILDQGEARALAIRERAASAAQLKQRNRMLAFKQQLIEEALAAGLSSLEEAPAEDYFAALLGLPPAMPSRARRRCASPPGDLRRLPADFPARLKEAAPQADIAISQKPWETGGGFLLVTGDIDINCTFQAIFEGLRGPCGTRWAGCSSPRDDPWPTLRERSAALWARIISMGWPGSTPGRRGCLGPGTSSS